MKLQLKWHHQFQFAGYYAAIAKGYYREANLEVELLEARPGEDPVRLVLQGGAQYGVGTSELILLRAKGEPVVVLAAIYQHSPLALIARRDDGINDMHDLAGRPIMIEPQSAELFAYFKAEGVDPEKLKIVHHTFSVDDLIRRQVAAMSAYSTDEPFLLQQAGIESMTFTPRSGGVDFYGDNLFTTEAELRDHPDRVRAFRAASLKGWEYALAHPEEMVALILKEYSTRKSREHLLFEAEETRRLMHPELIEVGHMNPGRWRHMADTYADFGMIPRDFKLGGFLHQSNSQPDLRWVYWLSGVGLLFAAAALVWALPLYLLNRKLRHQIAGRMKVEADLMQAKEAAEEAGRAKSLYLAVMTHEVRAPLCGIISMMRFLRTEASARVNLVENIRLIEDSSENLLKLIDEALDYSRFEAGAVETESLPASPGRLLGDACGLFQSVARSKGISLEHEVGAGVPEIVMTDPGRVRQVLSNLLSNAIKFTAEGGVKARVTSRAGAKPGRCRLMFAVSDTGEGIPPESMGELFKPFKQADPSVTRRHGGTGLGLSISRHIAQHLGGDIRVESTPGRGSTFTVEIEVEVTG